MWLSPPFWGGAGGGAFIVIAVVPLAAGLAWALLYSLGLVGGLATGFTFENWQKTLKNTEFWASLGLSLAVAAIVVALSSGLAMAALLLFKGLLFEKKNALLATLAVGRSADDCRVLGLSMAGEFGDAY